MTDKNTRKRRRRFKYIAGGWRRINNKLCMWACSGGAVVVVLLHWCSCGGACVFDCDLKDDTSAIVHETLSRFCYDLY